MKKARLGFMQRHDGLHKRRRQTDFRGQAGDGVWLSKPMQYIQGPRLTGRWGSTIVPAFVCFASCWYGWCLWAHPGDQPCAMYDIAKYYNPPHRSPRYIFSVGTLTKVAWHHGQG